MDLQPSTLKKLSTTTAITHGLSLGRFFLFLKKQKTSDAYHEVIAQTVTCYY